MNPTIAPVTLTGTIVRFEPLRLAHIDGLTAAAAEDRRTYEHTTVPHEAEAMAAYVADLLTAWRAEQTIPFAQIRSNDNRPCRRDEIRESSHA